MGYFWPHPLYDDVSGKLLSKLLFSVSRRINVWKYFVAGDQTNSGIRCLWLKHEQSYVPTTSPETL